MTNRTVKISAQAYARIAGVLYLINIACGLFGEIFVRGHLVVAGDAVTTAHRIMSSEFLFRCGIAGDLIMHITDVPMAVIFYVLLRPVSKDLSLLSALFGMLQTAILCANKLNLVTVLLLLGGTSSLKAFDPSQLQALASLSLSLHAYGFGIGLIFFGMSCLVARARPNNFAAGGARDRAPEPGALLDFGLEHWVDEGGAVVARSAIARFRPPLHLRRWARRETCRSEER